MVMFTGLARVAREAGLTVRETSGWKTRTAHRGGMRAARGVLWHHTATAASAVRSRNNPTLNYMINGLGYPLANYGLAWDGSVDVIAAGTGAHAGKGSYSGIPRDQGNYYLIGIEVEGTTGLTWSNAQLEAAAKLGAQLDKEFGGLMHIGHYEYAPRRKVDPTGIPGNMPALRSAIKRGYWSTKTSSTTPATTPQPVKKASWFEMATEAQLRKIIREEVRKHGWSYKGSESRDAWSFLRNSLLTSERIEKELDNFPQKVWSYKGTDERLDAYAFLRGTRNQVAALKGQNDGLLKALEQAGATDLDAIREATEAGVKAALDSVEADVTLNIDTTSGDE